MGLYKRAGSPYYWYKFRLNGVAIRESAGTASRQEAEQVEAKRKRDIWEEQRLGVVQSPLWQDAVVAYLDTMPESNNKRNTRYTLTWLGKHLDGWRVGNIDNAKLQKIRVAKIVDINKAKAAQADRGSPSRWPTAQPSAVNRVLGIVGAVINYCVAAETVQHAPKIPLMKVPQREPVWGTRDRVMALIRNLPEHQVPMVIFDLEVGWRRSNVTHLQWAQVDRERRFAWVSPEDAKESKGIPTPLSDVAMEVIEAQVGKDPVWVFPYRGGPVEQTSTRAFRRARDTAGLPKTFTWHALRHTWASWHIQGDTPKHILQELGGWKSDKMVAAYAHLGGEHLTRYVSQHQGLSSVKAELPGTKEGTVRVVVKKKKVPKSLIPKT